jgi:DNA polymerase V
MARGGFRIGAGRKELSGNYGEKTKPVRLPISMIEPVQNLLKQGRPLENERIPFYESRVSAGSPLPAEDQHNKVNLHQHLVKNPDQTFVVTATGDSMIGAGINHQDLLVVDRSITPKTGDIIVAAVDGDVTVKRFRPHAEGVMLMPDNPEFEPIKITSERDFHIWGVVTSIIHGIR